jgi:hypothetical protein
MSTSTKAVGSGGAPVLGGEIGRVGPSQGRATPKGPGFGAVLAGARPILAGAEAVASVLPGGPLVAAAVKSPMSAPGVPAAGHLGAPGGVGMAPRVPVGPGGPGGGPPLGAAPGTGPVSGGPPEGAGIEGVLAESQAFNLYYLQLQEQISSENRSYSALSNVLKARHDTVKNAIGNIR